MATAIIKKIGEHEFKFHDLKFPIPQGWEIDSESAGPTTIPLSKEALRELDQMQNSPSFDLNVQEIAALHRIQDKIHASAVNAGWYTNLETGLPIKRNFGEVLALMHSELSEALEGHRKNLMDTHLPHRKMVEVELADCIIRILDTAGAEGLDIAGAIAEKLHYNQHREDHKIENRRGSNGKKI